MSLVQKLKPNSLFRKDFIELFSSTVSINVLGAFLFVLALMLWVVPGEYNVIDGGMAITDSLFRLSSLLLLVLIPAITMRSFADEKRQGTWDLLLLRPWSSSTIFWSKLSAVSAAIFIALLITVIHPLLISSYSAPNSGLDWGVVLTSYVGLMLWVVSLVAIGLFASLVSSNQPMAFVVALSINLIFNFGFELVSIVPGLADLQSFADSLSLTAHYKSMQRGVIDSRDLIYFATLILLFSVLSLFFFRRRENRKAILVQFSLFALLIAASWLWFVRFDLTEERRYTLSNYSKSTLSQVQSPITITVYLDGELNAGFTRLRNGVGELIDESNIYAASPIRYQYVDPTASTSKEVREKAYQYLVSKGMAPISVNETDRSGKISQKLVFPWAQIVSGGDTIRWSLLQNQPGNSGSENLNASLETLELNFSEALHRLVQRQLTPIAFLEGHNELPEPFLASTLDRLARNYRIDRGVIGNDPAILSPYKVVVIAAPQKPFTEAEKFVIDQYLMQGGRVLWLVDGAQLSLNDLSTKGESTAATLDLNLTDLFFNYGVRVNLDLVQDAQCLSIPLKNPDNQGEVFPAPWIYAPVMTPNQQHLIGRNVSPVKAEFVSSMELVGENAKLNKQIILSTSAKSKIIPLPILVSYQMVFDKLSSNYFSNPSVPTAVLLEGNFPSLYRHRFLPAGVNGANALEESKQTRMMVVSAGSVIRNEVRRSKEGNAEPVPLGYEPYEDIQYGNLDFVTNAVQYLAGDEAQIALRSRQFVLRLLDKVRLIENLTLVQLIASIVPLFFLIAMVAILYFWRKRRYCYNYR